MAVAAPPFLHEALTVEQTDQIGHARRRCLQAAEIAGLARVDAAAAGIVATELATNLVKHASGGRILVAHRPGYVSILSIDKGRGIGDISAAMRDGFSTGGSRGEGLGAIRRMSTEFDLYSHADYGAVIWATLGKRAPDRWESYGLSIPYPGETECGDAFGTFPDTAKAAFCLADGLGHGPLAARPARELVETVAHSPFSDPVELLDSAHTRLRGSRGAAASVAVADAESRTLEYAGIGNISGALVAGLESRALVSSSGTLGIQAVRKQKLTFPWTENALLVLHSDGLSPRWSLQASYPGLFSASPAVIAAVLYRDNGRANDDATILVVRLRSGGNL